MKKNEKNNIYRNQGSLQIHKTLLFINHNYIYM